MKKSTSVLLSTIIGGTAGAIGGAINVYRRERKQLNLERKTTQKDNEILKAYSHWIRRKQKGESLVGYFKRAGYKKIAIYGMHYLGESLVSELEDSDIEIVCAIDKYAELRYTDLPLYKPDESIPEVDAVIVTAFFYFDEIKNMLLNKMHCPIISIEDIIYESELDEMDI